MLQKLLRKEEEEGRRAVGGCIDLPEEPVMSMARRLLILITVRVRRPAVGR